MFLKTVFDNSFENTGNTILVLFVNRSYSLNLAFFVFSVFFRTKNWESNVFSMFSLFSLFL